MASKLVGLKIFMLPLEFTDTQGRRNHGGKGGQLPPLPFGYGGRGGKLCPFVAGWGKFFLPFLANRLKMCLFPQLVWAEYPFFCIWLPTGDRISHIRGPCLPFCW